MSIGSSIAGIILAAGRSERMGRPKALLPFREKPPVTFVEQSVSIFRRSGIENVVLVANHETRDAVAAVVTASAHVVVNEHPEDGMVSSIIVALGAFRKEPDALLVTLVDIPEVRETVVKAMMNREVVGRCWMLVPRYDDGVGHPVMIYRAAYAELSTELPRGLKSLMQRDPGRIEEIRVTGTQPWDVDTPEDYGRFHESRRRP